ncbi:UDP-galactose:beta-D-galactoside beta-1,4-galactosyltransferase [Elysia marginata]|uniref:Glycosyltransferase family 92 protein n=1 Tax=Elysia marginata TaxID=1093978 RepID=A0AAV4I1X5_9GAST|nr:UDP-galactose:beta-D-galactoside beta-1,4-galactosyltransferase [Elysia marginata]
MTDAPEKFQGVNQVNLESVQHLKRVAPYIDGVPHRFELVKGISSNLYIYGALWDVQHVRLVSIMVQGYIFKHLLCVLYYTIDKSKTGVYVKPVVKELHTYKSPYTSAVIKCPINSEVKRGDIPIFVGLTENGFESPKQLFLVQNYLRGKTEVSQELTVCVPALFHMTNTALVVQKIEMVRLFGAGRIVFYNHSVSSDVDAALRMYAREWTEGRENLEVVTLPWKLPFEDGKPISIPYYAQQLAIDDCMYRYKRLSKYMVFNDLDEYIVPLKHKNWSTLIAERLRFKPHSIAWLFRSSVLNNNRPSPGEGFEADYLRYGSSILGLTSRDQYVFPANHRAKTIVDPSAVEEKGVHRIWDGKGHMDIIPVDVAILFHYRSPLNKCSPQVKETRVVDKYGKRLVARLKQAWSKLPGIQLGWSPFKAADRNECESS